MFDGIYISGQVQGVDVNITVDTGASVSLISEDLYHNIPREQKPYLEMTTQHVSAADGAKLRCSGTADFILALGPVVVNKRFVVADIQDEVLLGADFLQKDVEGPVDLILSEDRMVFRGQSVPLQQILTSKPSHIRKVRVADDCVIPGMCEKTMEVVLDKTPPEQALDVCLFLEANQELAQDHSLIMAPCLVNVSDDVPLKAVRILNPNDNPVTLRRGMVLGTAEGISKVEAPPPSEQVRRAVPSEVDAGPDEVPTHLQELYDDTCTTLSPDERLIVKQLLIDFSDIFSTSDDDLGLTHLTEHTINTGNATPVKQAPRRVPLAYSGEDKKALDKLLKQGCIRPSNSPWASPVVFVLKRDKSVRPCYDMRRVNELTVKDSFPLPRTEDCLDAVSGAKLFSTLDITSAYNQVPVREQDIPKTAFVTKYGLFEHVTMPFGLCNAPATFQRLMEIALNGLQWNTCLIYLDDVICFSKATVTEHAERLRSVLERIRSAGLKLKPRKCSLFQTTVKFLGHVISEDGILPNPDNVQRLADWPIPTRVKDVRAFLGLGNYYRRFVRNYSQIVKPLTELTKKNQVFRWTEECQSAFDSLKTVLLGPEVMAYPTDDGEYTLDCDACDLSIGAVLSQHQGGQDRVIAYGSRTLNKAEQNYCVTDRELLAVKHFTELYKHYLLGRKFAIRTDHQALKWLFTLKEPKGRVARWIEILSAFNFSIEYRPGQHHGNADGMSRCPDPRACECEDSNQLPCGPCNKCTSKSVAMQSPFSVEITRRTVTPGMALAEGGKLSSIFHKMFAQMMCLLVFLGLITPDSSTRNDHNERVARSPPLAWSSRYSAAELRKKQLDDPDIGPVLQWKEADKRPSSDEVQSLSAATRHYWLYWKSLEIRNGQLHRKFAKRDGTGEQFQFILPRKMQQEVMFQMHNSVMGGHLGQKKTRAKVKQMFYWFGLREDVNCWVGKCEACGAVKRPAKSPRAPLGKMTVGAVMDRLSTDILGPLPKTIRGNIYVLVVTDHFSKWVEIFAIPDQTASTTARVILNEVIARFGCPYTILSDQGRNYESELFSDLCRLLEIRKTRTTTANPRCNGQTERFNRTLLKMIKSYIDGVKDNEWDLNLGCLAAAYRATPHESTSMTPNLLMLGREVRLPVETMLGASPDDADEVVSYCAHVSSIRDHLQHAHEVARKHLQASSKRQKDSYDAKKSFHRFEPGDYVWYATARNQLQMAPKLRKPFEGPFVVLKRINDLVYPRSV